jgi:hypothetical protein
MDCAGAFSQRLVRLCTIGLHVLEQQNVTGSTFIFGSKLYLGIFMSQPNVEAKTMSHSARVHQPSTFFSEPLPR